MSYSRKRARFAPANGRGLVLAGAPTGNPDRAASDEVFGLMRRMHAELNTSFLVVTHDSRLAERCDRVIERIDGRIESDQATPAMAR
jgi:lipoprotein-releasing system ATP-binding protein